MTNEAEQSRIADWANTPPWARDADDVIEKLDVDPAEGLSESEAKRRLEQVGANRLRESKQKPWWRILINQFMSIIIGLLVAAALVAFLFGEYVEMIAIGVVILINTAIGFATELRAVRSMEALREIAEVSVVVRRDGDTHEIPSHTLVPGDVVLLESGNLVAADMRILRSSEMEADESVLTGESVPVEKSNEPIDADTVLAERKNMLYRGTAVTRGRGLAVVAETGMGTEVGRISELVEEAVHRETPLEERLDELGRNLVWVCLALAGMVAGIGLAQGKELFTVIETAIALAVATIPEGLPIVATIALARGMWRMAERNALVRNLAVVETLGSTNTILTDKTGTLTENRMTVAHYAGATGDIEAHPPTEDRPRYEFEREDAPVDPGSDPVLGAALEIGFLCNDEVIRDAEEQSKRRVGEPMETALINVATGAGLDRDALLDKQPRIREEPFDSATSMMATYHENGESIRVTVKGAPERVLDASTRILTDDGIRPMDQEERQHWRDANERLGESGLRLLGLAQKHVDDSEAPPYEDLVFVGLVGMVDPPREDVGPALDACREAGIRVVMVTGDQPGTALYVARELDMADGEPNAVHGRDLGSIDDAEPAKRDEILAAPVFARVTPEQKLDLIQLHQESGATVAMTGDGVNDAPALVEADIGVAMGQRGTQVAREAADMVLGDDRFQTIVAAVEQGRIIFENIRKFAVYLLSCNVSELFVVSIAALIFADQPLPLTALQILFLNLVTDVFPALALGLGEGDKRLMDRPPRDPEESILTRKHWMRIAGYGGVMTLSVLGAFYIAIFEIGLTNSQAVSVSFLTLALAQLWHVFNMRTSGTSRFYNDVTRNPWVWGALVLCVGLIALAVYFTPLASVISVTDPGTSGWLVAIGASVIPVIVGHLRR